MTRARHAQRRFSRVREPSNPWRLYFDLLACSFPIAMQGRRPLASPLYRFAISSSPSTHMQPRRSASADAAGGNCPAARPHVHAARRSATCGERECANSAENVRLWALERRSYRWRRVHRASRPLIVAASRPVSTRCPSSHFCTPRQIFRPASSLPSRSITAWRTRRCHWRKAPVR